MKLLSLASILALSAAPLAAGCAHDMGAGMMKGASGKAMQTCPPTAARSGQAESGAMMSDGKGGAMMADGKDGAMMGDGKDGAMTGDGKGGAMMGDGKGGAMMGEGKGGAMMGDGKGGAMMGDAQKCPAAAKAPAPLSQDHRAHHPRGR